MKLSFVLLELGTAAICLCVSIFAITQGNWFFACIFAVPTIIAVILGVDIIRSN